MPVLIKLIAITLFLNTIKFLPLDAQAKKIEIVINVTQTASEQPGFELTPQMFINGYRKSLGGQIIEYHSIHPDANQALLVRAKREVGSIVWETDTLPNVNSDYYNLIWLAGIEKSGWQQTKAHRFYLSINGQHWLTFKNLKDSTALHWKVFGKNGSELSFASSMTDRFGDLFGYMYLKLPKKEFNPGLPLTLEINGEDADSPDWYMTFQHNFNFIPKMRLEPALLHTKTSSAQMIRLSIDNLNRGKIIEISTSNNNSIRESLKVGSNIFFLPIEEVKEEQQLKMIFNINGKLTSESNITIGPIAKRDIYLLSYSHNDIGYTDLQPYIERKQMENIDATLQLIKQTKDYPLDAKFKWNMEVIWALESYLKQASEEKRREVIEAIRNGSIGLNALYANVLTGLANGVEMMHFTEYAGNFANEYSFPITTAVVSDIPGFTWGIVPVLAQSGVKYFSSAPNSGDRVGHIYEALGDKPFYWISQSGEEKILMWLTAASYSSFHEGDLAKLGDEKIFKMMRKLDENNYPYDIVQLPYTIGGDNGTPDSNLSGFVKNWNERYFSPRIIISTHEQMFEEFEKRYGSTLPTMKGDFTPYWEDGAFSSAYETFLNRRATDRLIQSEVIWSMHSPSLFPQKDYYDAWRQVVLYDEHTWGAHNSITNPDSSFVKEQWEIKKQFALNADSMSQKLLSKATMESVENGTAFDIYNTNSWTRTDLVLIPKKQSVIGDLVIDESGKKIASQRLTTGELAFVADKIPPISAKRYYLKNGKSINKGKTKTFGTTLNNNLLSVTVDGLTGVIDELIWNKGEKQLVDTKDLPGINYYCYVRGKNPDSTLQLSNVKVKVKERGTLVASLIIKADAPGCKSFSTEVRIIDGINRVDIINHIDKTAMREKEGMHLGFPFKVAGGQLRYDVAWGIVRPEQDQLPGSCKNFFSVQNFVDVSNSEFGVTWATPDASLIEIGAINAEKPWMKKIEPSQIFYSYVMNNYWHTNYKADQEGPVTIRYSIQPHGEFKQEDAVRFGREQRELLIAVSVDPLRKISTSLFTVEPSKILVTSCKPTTGGWHIQLYNASTKVQRTKIQWNKTIPVSMYRGDLFEKVRQEFKEILIIPPYGIRDIQIDRK